MSIAYSSSCGWWNEPWWRCRHRRGAHKAQVIFSSRSSPSAHTRGPMEYRTRSSVLLLPSSSPDSKNTLLEQPFGHSPLSLHSYYCVPVQEVAFVSNDVSIFGEEHAERILTSETVRYCTTSTDSQTDCPQERCPVVSLEREFLRCS